MAKREPRDIHVLNWLKENQELLISEPPLQVLPHPPLKEIQEGLRKLFETPDLTLSLIPIGWRKEIEKENQGNSRIFEIALQPLKASLFFIIDGHSQAALWTALLNVHTPIYSLLDREMTLGALDFFILQTLEVVRQSQFAKPLTFEFRGVRKELSFADAYYENDLSCQIGKQQIWIKFLISKELHSQWRHYFINAPRPPLSEEEQSRIHVNVALQVGSAKVSTQELRSLKVGDFLLLDGCLYDPQRKKGSLLVTLEEKPLFRAKVREEGLHLSEYPLYEEEMVMDDEEFEDEDLEEQAKAEPKDENKEREIFASLDELEMNLSVELCRLKMSVKELVALHPGSTLPLNLPMEKAVNLVVNGKKYAQGELMRMGEMVGVRILALKEEG